MNRNINEMIEYPKEGILSKDLAKEPFNVTLFCMTAGADLSEHTSTHAGIIYFIEGKGEFKLAGKSIKIAPGAVIIMNANEKHSLKAEEKTSFLLMLK